MDGMIKIGDKTYGVDEFGEYGSLARDDNEAETPEAPNLEPPPPPWPIDEVETDQTDETP